MLEHATYGKIIPGIGLGNVRLGMSRSDVQQRFGEPLLRTEADAEGDASFEYPGRVHLYFHGGEGFRLSLILIEDVAGLTFSGRRVVATQEALSWLDGEKAVTHQTRFLEDEGRVTVEWEHSFPDSGITLYSDEHGLLVGCAISVVIDAEDRFRWPGPNS